MKKKILISLATVVAFLATFVAQVSAASACLWFMHDPELPKELK
jgi:cyclic lactone autoinducer peptide